jgi:hypothetical protein
MLTPVFEGHAHGPLPCLLGYILGKAKGSNLQPFLLVRKILPAEASVSMSRVEYTSLYSFDNTT